MSSRRLWAGLSALYPIAAARNPSEGYRRRLIEIFTEQIGMTPKIFCRVCRFQRAINEIQRRALPWTEIATGCGYYDQAHFINEFRTLSGLTPSDYCTDVARV